MIDLNKYHGMDDVKFTAQCIIDHVDKGYTARKASMICQLILANRKETEFSKAIKKGFDSGII